MARWLCSTDLQRLHPLWFRDLQLDLRHHAAAGGLGVVGRQWPVPIHRAERGICRAGGAASGRWEAQGAGAEQMTKFFNAGWQVWNKHPLFLVGQILDLGSNDMICHSQVLDGCDGCWRLGCEVGWCLNGEVTDWRFDAFLEVYPMDSVVSGPGHPPGGSSCGGPGVSRWRTWTGNWETELTSDLDVQWCTYWRVRYLLHAGFGEQDSRIWSVLVRGRFAEHSWAHDSGRKVLNVR